MNKYQQLEEKIQELQEELERLKKEEQENKLPDRFKIESVLEFLEDTSKVYLIDDCFTWDTTPQGSEYWCKLYDEERTMTDRDIIQLQKWCILYYQQEQQSK